MITYAFELGHQPHVSRAEIISVLRRLSLSYTEPKSANSFFVIQCAQPLNAPELIQILGGTIRIARSIPTHGDEVTTIASFLDSATDGKIQFSISGIKNDSLALRVKKYLKEQGRSVRYVEAKNTATIIHNKLVEKKGDIIKIGQQWFVTEAVQDIESFSERDYGRPRVDSRSGMLPPKLARMMVNLSEAPLYSHILDPFCGSGTVLTEALSLGYTHVSGSDNSDKAIEDSTENISWFLKQYPDAKVKATTHLASALKLSNTFPKESVDAIVSEPYMGKPLRGHESRLTLQIQAQELKDLYLKSFEQFKLVLSKKGVVVFIIPIFKSGTEWIRTDAEKDIEKMGFTITPFDTSHTSLLYHRENQFVGREIWKFTKS